MLFFGVNDCRQWSPEVHNEVDVALSRGGDRSDDELTTILKIFCSSQIPEYFKIVPLPAEVISYLISVLQRLPVKHS